jgi:hypothetical protein
LEKANQLADERDAQDNPFADWGVRVSCDTKSFQRWVALAQALTSVLLTAERAERCDAQLSQERARQAASKRPGAALVTPTADCAAVATAYEKNCEHFTAASAEPCMRLQAAHVTRCREPSENATNAEELLQSKLDTLQLRLRKAPAQAKEARLAARAARACLQAVAGPEASWQSLDQGFQQIADEAAVDPDRWPAASGDCELGDLDCSMSNWLTTLKCPRMWPPRCPPSDLLCNMAARRPIGP